MVLQRQPRIRPARQVLSSAQVYVNGRTLGYTAGQRRFKMCRGMASDAIKPRAVSRRQLTFAIRTQRTRSAPVKISSTSKTTAACPGNLGGFSFFIKSKTSPLR